MEAVSFPTINLMKTGKNIERLRKERGISVRELQAYLPSIGGQFICAWENTSCSYAGDPGRKRPGFCDFKTREM